MAQLPVYPFDATESLSRLDFEKPNSESLSYLAFENPSYLAAKPPKDLTLEDLLDRTKPPPRLSVTKEVTMHLRSLASMPHHNPDALLHLANLLEKAR